MLGIWLVSVRCASNPVEVPLDSPKQDFEAMQESTSTGLWFSPDYTPEITSPPKAIQLPAGLPQFAEPITSTSTMIDKQLKIMIWGNSPSEAQHIEAELRKTGYDNLRCATTYEDGLEQIKENRFDFFIIDLSLDGIGTKLIQALRASDTYRHTPMLICTESQLIPDMLNAMKAGANDLICKPINNVLLEKKISLHSRMVPSA